MFENPRRGRRARNFTKNVPKILDLKSIVFRTYSFRKLTLDTPEFYCRRINLTPTNYFLRPGTGHRPHQSSQYDAFPSQARDQCFPHLATMRWNTVTYWTTADFANRETCSFIRLNDAFQKTSLQADKKKSRKLTDQGKQLLQCMMISNVIVFYDKERILGNSS